VLPQKLKYKYLISLFQRAVIMDGGGGTYKKKATGKLYDADLDRFDKENVEENGEAAGDTT
jgi:hypothetical protein